MSENEDENMNVSAYHFIHYEPYPCTVIVISLQATSTEANTKAKPLYTCTTRTEKKFFIDVHSRRCISAYIEHFQIDCIPFNTPSTLYRDIGYRVMTVVFVFTKIVLHFFLKVDEPRVCMFHLPLCFMERC